LRKELARMVEAPDGVPTHLLDGLGLCQRQIEILGEELQHIAAMVKLHTADIEAIERLQTIPGVGHIVATNIYAAVGDVSRFPNAKSLCAYAGLVPTVRQSGGSAGHGRITKEGSKPLRATLVQAAHIAASRCQGDAVEPLRAIYTRIRGTRGRRKIAIVALARHLLRIAYYVLRDGTVYDASRLRAT
jgi:transposase